MPPDMSTRREGRIERTPEAAHLQRKQERAQRLSAEVDRTWWSWEDCSPFQIGAKPALNVPAVPISCLKLQLEHLDKFH